MISAICVALFISAGGLTDVSGCMILAESSDVCLLAGKYTSLTGGVSVTDKLWESANEFSVRFFS